jgi:preprotein translocase subunit SecY
MPVIFASSLLAAPTALARYFNTPAVTSFAKAVSPAGSLYLPVYFSSSRGFCIAQLAAIVVIVQPRMFACGT